MAKAVMIRAWVVAREAVAKFGGKAREYIAAALKQAWAEARAPKVAARPTLCEIEIGTNKRSKSWLAAIVGPHATFRWQREFISYHDINRYGEQVYRVTDGVYEVCDKGSRNFILVQNGEYRRLDERDIAKYIIVEAA